MPVFCASYPNSRTLPFEYFSTPIEQSPLGVGRGRTTTYADANTLATAAEPPLTYTLPLASGEPSILGTPGHHPPPTPSEGGQHGTPAYAALTGESVLERFGWSYYSWPYLKEGDKFKLVMRTVNILVVDEEVCKQLSKTKRS